jgi:predicted molibdopterin-dependent oxidoreductase YjgC
MLRRLEIGRERVVVHFRFEERTIEAREGDTIAAALLAAGISHFRSAPESGSPRAPYCMMGVCFECLVEVDGLANCQSCMVRVEPGMRVRRQDGNAEVSHGE